MKDKIYQTYQYGKWNKEKVAYPVDSTAADPVTDLSGSYFYTA